MGAKLQAAITQMNSGKIAPVMEGRTDVQVYPYSCRKTKNAIPLVYGSNRNRGGSAFVSAVKNSANKTALIPFKVGENVAYQIEFGDKYLRFYKNHELILQNDSPYEIETDYAIEDLYDAKGILQIDYQQSGDVLYLVHDKYPPQKLMRYGDTDWRIASLNFTNGPWQNINTDKNLVIKASATTGVINLSSFTGANPVAYDSGVSTGGSFPSSCAGQVVFYVGGHNGQGTLTASYSWGYNEMPQLSFAEIIAQQINALPQFIATNPTRGSIRIEAVSNQQSYSGVLCDIYCYTTHPITGDTWANNNFSFSVVDGATEIFTQDWVDRYIRITQTNTVNTVWYAGLSVSINDIVTSDGNYYKAQSAGTAGNIKPTHTEGIASDGGVTWLYLHSGYGIAQIIEYVSSYEVKAKVLDYIPDGVVNTGSWLWEFSMFDRVNNIWPSSVAFFKDRLAFGANVKSGPTLFLSCSGDYENFSDKTNGEVLATNAITLPILLDLNKIQWLCAQDNLFVGTEGGIVAVKAMTSSEVFGPDNITYDNISSIGTCKIKPIRIGDDILYLGRLAKDIYAIQYNWETDSYAPDEVSLLAYDLLEEGISGWALQYEPDRIIWLVRKDGKLLGLTYNKKQSVRAFHLHETDGQFESVSSIPAPDGTMDEIYFVAKRTVNNATVRYVEYFKNGLPLNAASGLTVAQKLEYLLKNSWFLDCAKKYTFAEATDAITGLSHLEGKTVAILADGKVQESKTVTSGAITLDSVANLVLVGLPYETIIEPMPLNIDVGGTGQARSQRINQIICRLYRSANFKFSWDNATWHNAEVKDDTELTLKSGDLLLNWGASNTLSKLNSEDIVNATGARMLFKQDLPLPVCFVAFYPQIEVSNG